MEIAGINEKFSGNSIMKILLSNKSRFRQSPIGKTSGRF